jgi:hypothetical protein
MAKHPYIMAKYATFYDLRSAEKGQPFSNSETSFLRGYESYFKHDFQFLAAE